MTASDVHKKIKEISLKYISKKPPISIANLATELDLQLEKELMPCLKSLEYTGWIRLDKEHVWITDAGLNEQPG